MSKKEYKEYEYYDKEGNLIVSLGQPIEDILEENANLLRTITILEMYKFLNKRIDYFQ